MATKKMSRESYDKLVAELDDLKINKRKEVAERLKVARSYGDLSENAEYDEAKNEQAQVYGRKAEIENILAHAVIIDDGLDGVEDAAAGRVGLGCTVKVRDMELDEECLYAIVGSQEADPKNYRISDDSPFGRAMLGKTVGAIVTVEAPVGTLQFEILSVEK